jgi:four helix bundle protein
MAFYRKFEELPVWKNSRELTTQIYKLTENSKFRRDFGLVDQIRRFSISISSNIAEGFERGSKKEFIQFLYIVKGSAGELRSQLYTTLDLGYIDKVIHQTFLTQAESLSRQLTAFITSIKEKIK